jgi:thioredoxin reductase (NADPH)
VNTTRWAVVSAGFPETVPAATVDRQCGSSALREEAGHLVVRLTDGTDVVGRAVIVATGARYRRLAASRLGNTSTVAFTRSDLRKGPPMRALAGGRRRRWQLRRASALFLAESGSPVTVVIRRSDLSDGMSRYLVDRIIENSRIDARSNTMTARGSASLH